MTTSNITFTNGSGSTGYSNLTVTTGTGVSNSTVWATSASPYYSTNTHSSINLMRDATRGDVLIQNGNLKINGPDADIQIGEVSLKKFMEDVSLRLSIMQPNTKLEKDWEELKELGDRYRQLEKEMIEKAKVWNILKTP